MTLQIKTSNFCDTLILIPFFFFWGGGGRGLEYPVITNDVEN